MDDKLIKWALLAAGAYFLYDWYMGQPAAPAAQPEGGTGTGTGPAAAAVNTDAANAGVSDAERLRAQALVQQQLQDAARRTPVSAPAVGGVVQAVVDQVPWLSPGTAVAVGNAYSQALTAARAMVQAAPTAQVAAAAAAGGVDGIAEAERRAMRFTYHQWNWYRAQALGVAQPDPATFQGDPSVPVSVTAYLAALKTAGLSGLGWAPVLPYSTAWSA